MVTTRSHLQKTHAQQHGSYTTPKLGRRPLPVLPIPVIFRFSPYKGICRTSSRIIRSTEIIFLPSAT
ncbi:unnamed protein product [Tenebrio molitor]|nr:unnamed protein product [Tenebrio molitor]